MLKNRRILVLSPFVRWPLVNGTVVRTWHLVNYLTRDNTIWLGCRGGKAAAPETGIRTIYNKPGRIAQLLHLGFLRRLWRLVEREKIDLLVISQLWGMVHGLLLKWLTGRPLLFDNHNVEFLRWRRMRSPLWLPVALLEFLACHGADLVICVSEEDRRLLANHLHVPVWKLRVLNNGVDVDRFYSTKIDNDQVRQELGVAPGEQEILFFGPLSHRANAQAVDVILDELIPRLKEVQQPWKIVVAGADAGPYLAKRKQAIPANVTFPGFVEDIVALIKSADVVIVPLTAGSGSRYKILEAVAAGRLVISTEIGAEGLELSVFGDSLRIENSWDGFVRAIEESWHRPLSLSPSADFVAMYDWERIFERLDLEL